MDLAVGFNTAEHTIPHQESSFDCNRYGVSVEDDTRFTASFSVDVQVWLTGVARVTNFTEWITCGNYFADGHVYALIPEVSYENLDGSTLNQNMIAGWIIYIPGWWIMVR